MQNTIYSRTTENEMLMRDTLEPRLAEEPQIHAPAMPASGHVHLFRMELQNYPYSVIVIPKCIISCWGQRVEFA